MTEPRPEWADATCIVCPAQMLGPGAFDVVERPDRRFAFNQDQGCRIDCETGTPVCVHPFRVGLAPGRYASAAEPIPAAAGAGAVFVPADDQLELPDQLTDLEGWLVAVLRSAPQEAMVSALDHAETIAAERFTTDEIVTALRRVLAIELAGH